ncbi:MAG: formylmethanofuran dehydrogenase subunit E family protein [Desulfuromonadales bacterium]|nr:formylmethanofuran dehydrogenase subunit E family protein [Desulfuromonadales bacterium]
MTDLSDLFLRIRARHGHYCPMSTLGGRLGEMALLAVGKDAGALTATYHIDTCAADGIAVATGCLPEEGRLKMHPDGLHRLELRGEDGVGVRAELTPTALERAAACRKQLDEGGAPDEVLTELRTGPADELIALTPLAGGENDA